MQVGQLAMAFIGGMGGDPEGQQYHAIVTTVTSAALRIIRGYRTVSFEATSLLAGNPSRDLEARAFVSL